MQTAIRLRRIGAKETMAEPLHVDRESARRFLVARHVLSPARSLKGGPDAVLEVVRRLGSLQFDPLSVAGRNHDLVLHARVADHDPAWTESLLYERRVLFETQNKGLSLLPIEELPWYRAWWVQDPQYPEILRDNEELTAQVLERLQVDGPLSALDFKSGRTQNWFGTNMSLANAVLDALWNTGQVALARREGNRRYFDLTERIYPHRLLDQDVAYRDQMRHKLRSRFQAHGLLGIISPAMVGLGPGRPDPNHPEIPSRADLREELIEMGEIVPVHIDGVKSVRYVMGYEVEALLNPPPSEPSVSFLAPLDPLIWDTTFLSKLWDYDYVWEVYLRPEKRRYGYYVLPMLFGERFVGKIEPRIDRTEGRVRILSLHWEARFDPAETNGFIPAMRLALADYLRFARANELVWSEHLRTEQSLFSISSSE